MTNSLLNAERFVSRRSGVSRRNAQSSLVLSFFSPTGGGFCQLCNSTIAFSNPIGTRSLKHSRDRPDEKETEARAIRIFHRTISTWEGTRIAKRIRLKVLFSSGALPCVTRLAQFSPGISPGKQRDDALLPWPRLNSAISRTVFENIYIYIYTAFLSGHSRGFLHLSFVWLLAG